MQILSILLLATVCLASSVGQQESISLTIYNDEYAMVKDVRRMNIDLGESQLHFTDVSSTIVPQTVMFKPKRPTKQTQAIQVFQQNFQNNLVSRYGILKNYLQEPISIDVKNGNSLKRVNGSLLSYQNGFILQNGQGVSIYDNAQAVHVKDLSEDLLLKPTLVWRVFSSVTGTASFQVAYRATGFSWKADYLLELDEDEESATFMGWVTIDNRSGKKYRNANIKLIAGDVQTVRPQPRGGARNRAMAKSAVLKGSYGAAPQFTEKSFSDYHMYTLSQKVNLNESSRKQIQFIRPAYNVSVDKYYSTDISTGGGGIQKLSFDSFVKFLNSKNNRLGVPLPKGVIRVFKSDKDDGSLEFVGEDTINHTPRDQNITIRTGSPFDVAGTLKALKKQDLYRNTTTKQGRSSNYIGYDAQMELEIRNHGDISRSFKVKLNNYNGDNTKIEMVSKNMPWTKESATKFVLDFELAANKTAVFRWKETYRT